MTNQPEPRDADDHDDLADELRLETAAGGAEGVPVAGRVSIAELSGSESVIHFSHGSLAWISQSHGIHPFKIGDTARLHIDVGRCLYFGADGRLVAS